MTSQEAIGILMLSPFYFKMSPADRKKLVQEYCDFFNMITVQQNDTDNKQQNDLDNKEQQEYILLSPLQFIPNLFQASFCFENSGIMSIKLLAVELYRAQQNVGHIEAQLEATSLSALEVVREELRQAQAELRQLRKMLDDKKAASSLKTPPRLY